MYELSVAPASDTDALWVVVDSARIVETEGFERVSDGDRTRLEWTGDERGRVVLEVALDETTAGESAADRRAVATESWAFAGVPFVEVQRASDGEITRSWPLIDHLETESGVYGDRFALAGETTVFDRSVGNHSIRLVTPADWSGAESRADIADALEKAAVDLEVGDTNDSVLAFAVPGARSGGEAITGRDELWVNADEPLDSPDAVWLHEYVHTRQSVELTAEMEWFEEASAEYYAARLAYDQGRIDRAAFRAHLDGGPSRATLTNPDTWDEETVPYRKGARVLAVLNRKIEAATAGEQSLQTVFRRLNDHDGPVTYQTFERIVTDVAGPETGAWVEEHVARDRPVTGSFPAEAVGIAVGLVWLEVTPPSIPVATGLVVGVGFLLFALVVRTGRLGRSPDPVGSST